MQFGLRRYQAFGQQGRGDGAQVQFLARIQRAETIDHVGEFTHVARPWVFLQSRHEIGFEANRLFAKAGAFFGKEGQQLHHVGIALTQGRRDHRQYVEAVIQVFTEPTCCNFGFQIAVGRGDHTHIHLHLARTTNRVNGAFLQHAQQLDLHVQRHVANFIQEDGAAVCQLKATNAVSHSACEGALAVTKQLTL